MYCHFHVIGALEPFLDGKGGGISCSYASFGICEAIFRGRELIFFVGAHISIYFVNIKNFSPTSTLTTPQKPKNGKNRQIRSF